MDWIVITEMMLVGEQLSLHEEDAYFDSSNFESKSQLYYSRFDLAV